MINELLFISKQARDAHTAWLRCCNAAMCDACVESYYLMSVLYFNAVVSPESVAKTFNLIINLVNLHTYIKVRQKPVHTGIRS